MGGGISGEHPFEIVYACHIAAPLRNEHLPWGTILSARFCQLLYRNGYTFLSWWQLFHSVGVNRLSTLKVISSTVFPPLLDPISCRPTVFFTFLMVTMSLLVSILTSMHHIYVLASQSARNICGFVFGSCNEVDVIC